MSFIPVTNNEIPEKSDQMVCVILANYKKHKILARFAKNMSVPVMSYKRVERR